MLKKTVVKESLISTSTAILLVLTSADVFASSVDVPNTFTAGTPAVAAEVNANFDAVATSVNDNDSRITGNTDAISELQSARPQLVGFTSSTFEGAAGVLNFTEGCQADFPGSRMCTSTEIMETTAVPLLALESAWVRPDIITDTGTGLAIDASGVEAEAIDLSCDGWTSQEFTSTGLSVRRRGSFSLLRCDAPLPVACCLVGP